LEQHSWYVIQTRSRFEKKVVQLLTKAGIAAYLPLQEKVKRWSDRLKKVEEPLFAGYLFVQFVESERYLVLNTPGVVRFVSFGGEYAKINNKQIVAIKNVLSSDDAFEVVDLDFKTGEEVVITSGPFQDNYATVIRSNNGGQKVLLSLPAIGKGIVLEISKMRVEVSHRLVEI
jgi:transcriptional antiterminator RfaH